MTRALVLSGGGSVGIAWQTGLVAGLAQSGVSLADADLIVGTSAGSAVGAQIALGMDMQERVERYSREPESRPSRQSPRPAAAASTAERMQGLMRVMAENMTSDATPEEQRAAIGRFALEADTPPEDRFVAGFSYLAEQPWPRRYMCTAVEAETGDFVVWDEQAGVPLDRAVASSCAVPGLFAPITINGRRYIDGGMRSGTNADLAKGQDIVLIISLMSAARAAANPADPRLARYRERMDAELAALSDAGGRVEILGPDEAAAATMGENLMDPSRGPDAAQAGLAQGKRVADEFRDFWG